MAEKIKILMADDEPAVIDLVGKSLRDVGYEVIPASDGDEALKKIKSSPPDLVLLDVRMPKRDGFEVCRAIRESAEISSTPVIIVSALGDEYNKITGFSEGADDYVSKPVNIEELKARIKALLLRSKGLPPAVRDKKSVDLEVERIPSGLKVLDRCLGGGVPKGSNILVIGRLGMGKSDFTRSFISTGIKRSEKCMFIAVDDDPSLVRKELSKALPGKVADYERLGVIQFVDGFSWSTGQGEPGEKYAVTGTLDLTQLASVISDAGSELGQTVQEKAGGRRVIDSISSLLVNFDLPAVQKFLSQIARTSIAFGGVTTLYIMEQGSVTEQVLSNIKYLMDGVIEFGESKDKRSLRILHMKWIKYTKDWIEL
jgi:CheY-like chemotaxis protein/KaiC/GvpD/RAD55 family RecA-like ATPase